MPRGSRNRYSLGVLFARQNVNFATITKIGREGMIPADSGISRWVLFLAGYATFRRNFHPRTSPSNGLAGCR